MAQLPALVSSDGITPLQRMLTTDIAGASLAGMRSVITGTPSSGLDPVGLAQILRAAEQGNHVAYLELAEQMEEKYLHYVAVLGTRKRQVSQLAITVEAASDRREDQKKAQFIRDWLKRDTLEAELFDMLDAVGKGFSMTEIIWDLGHQPWLPARLEWRDPRWFEFARHDGRTPLLRTNHGPQPLPASKFIQHVHSAKSGLPIRGGIARAVAWAYLFQNFALKDWVAFAEVYGFPIRLGKYDAGATPENIKTLMQAVAGVSQDAAAVIPSSMQMEFITTNSTGSADLYLKLCEYLDKQVSKAVLGQTATTDSEGGGLGGSGREHNEVRGDIERADAKQLAATLNRDLVRPMIDFNFGGLEKGASKAVSLYPQINIGREDAEDTSKLLDDTAKFVAMGGRVAISVVRDKLGFPDPQDGEALLLSPEMAGILTAGETGPQIRPLGAPTAQSAPTGAKIAPPPFSGLPKPSQMALAAPVAAAIDGNSGAEPDHAHSSDDIDELVVLLVDEGWEAQMEPMIGPLREALTASSTYEEALAALVPALAKMDSTALAERLEKAAFAVRAAGLTGADRALAENGE